MFRLYFELGVGVGPWLSNLAFGDLSGVSNYNRCERELQKPKKTRNANGQTSVTLPL